MALILNNITREIYEPHSKFEFFMLEAYELLSAGNCYVNQSILINLIQTNYTNLAYKSNQAMLSKTIYVQEGLDLANRVQQDGSLRFKLGFGIFAILYHKPILDLQILKSLEGLGFIPQLQENRLPTHHEMGLRFLGMAFSDLIGSALFHPLAVIWINLVSEQSDFHGAGVLGTARKIFLDEGLSGFFVGIQYNLAFSLTKSFFKSILLDLGFLRNDACIFRTSIFKQILTFANAVVVYPFKVMLVREVVGASDSGVGFFDFYPAFEYEVASLIQGYFNLAVWTPISIIFMGYVNMGLVALGRQPFF